jgi:hypothetical protein
LRVSPAISTFLVAMSIRKSTWYRIGPVHDTTSTVKKSAAAIAPNMRFDERGP